MKKLWKQWQSSMTLISGWSRWWPIFPKSLALFVGCFGYHNIWLVCEDFPFVSRVLIKQVPNIEAAAHSVWSSCFALLCLMQFGHIIGCSASACTSRCFFQPLLSLLLVCLAEKWRSLSKCQSTKWFINETCAHSHWSIKLGSCIPIQCRIS